MPLLLLAYKKAYLGLKEPQHFYILQKGEIILTILLDS